MESQSVRASHRRFGLLLIAFIVFRGLSIVLLRPGGFVTDTGPDHNFYFEFARWAGGQKFALFDFWMEYPPLMPWLAGLAYRLSLALPPWTYAIFGFNLIFRLSLLPFEAGALILVYAIARRLGDAERALWLAALWTLLFAPFFAFLAWFDGMAVFFLLLALYGLLEERPILAGAAIGLGFVVKIFPVVLAPMGLFILRAPRQRLRYVGSAALVVLAVLLPPLLVSSGYVIAMFQAFFSRSSWETVWALLEGYTSYGAVALLNTHLDASAAGFQAHPATLPWGLISLAFALLYAFIITRRIDWRDRARVMAFALFSLMWFVLYSKGYSPQWAPYIAGMALLSLPPGVGLGYALLMDGFMVAELTLAFQVLRGEPRIVTGVIVLRTAIFCLLTLESLARALPEGRLWSVIRRYALPGALALSLVGGAGLTPLAWNVYTSQRLAAEPLAPFVATWRAAGESAAPVITVQSHLLERLAPYLGSDNVRWFPHIAGTPWQSADAWLAELAAQHRAAWFVYDESQATAQPALFEEMAAWFAAHACAGETTRYGALSVTPYFFAGEPVERAAAFESGAHLLTASALPTSLAPGTAHCLRLTWAVDAGLPADHAVLIHLRAPDGRVVAQADVWPLPPTSMWASGESYTSAHVLRLPDDLPPGRYTLLTGLYAIEGGARLSLLAGGDAAELGDLIVENP